MQDSNPDALLAMHNTSLYREIREFERFMLTHVTYTTVNMGLMEDVGVPVNKNYIIWGKIRPVKRFEFERIAGVLDDGSMILEFRMPMLSRVPQINDKVELHGVQSRQPRMRYLITQIFPDLSITIGQVLITPIGNKGVAENT